MKGDNKEILAKAAMRSYVFWALVSLVVLDFGARFTYPYWPYDHFASPNKSWVWWAVDDYRKQEKAPDLVLLGSSLMMAALHGGDANYLNRPSNVATHHKSALLEDLMHQKLGASIDTFAFALGGQMASDAYALCSVLMKGEKQPKAIIYGIAPRDFMDNTLSSPASTETYRYLSRVGDLSEVDWTSHTTFWEKVEYLCGQASFLYKHRNDLISIQQDLSKAFLQSTSPGKDLDSKRIPFELKKLTLLELPEDVGKNDVSVNPQESDHKYTDNLAEYRMRYAAFKPKLFEQQLSYLKRMLALCKERGIALVLVNMPLTKENVDLMPPGFYATYKERVASMAAQSGAQFIDLNDPKLFDKLCFADSVHMNGSGGVRFFKELAGQIAGQSRIAATVSSGTTK